MDVIVILSVVHKALNGDERGKCAVVTIISNTWSIDFFFCHNMTQREGVASVP